jgi:hypothetical protein
MSKIRIHCRELRSTMLGMSCIGLIFIQSFVKSGLPVLGLKWRDTEKMVISTSNLTTYVVMHFYVRKYANRHCIFGSMVTLNMLSMGCRH